jgi:hypothetical protein
MISDKDFLAIIDFFKKESLLEDVSCLISPLEILDSDSLRRLTVAWPYVKRTFKEFSDVPSSKEYWWEWLWSHVIFDSNQWGVSAGVPSCMIGLTSILIGNRIIYPDGTISDWARKVIRQYFKTQLDI